MKNKTFTRRRFLTLSGTGIGAGLLLPAVGFSSQITKSILSSENKITAGEVIDRIKKNVGVPWHEPTVDVIKAGTSDIIVTGLVTTFMATLDVLQKAVKNGKNFIITHEPTFWSNLDGNEGLTEDPMYIHKREFIKEHGLVVWRFHDHWHARRPDGINEGFDRLLGWENYPFDKTHETFELPETVTLAEFAKDVKAHLKSDSIRVIGNPSMKVKKVSKGFNKLPGGVAQVPFADAFIVKEADRENDLAEWCRDIQLSGHDKGFIFISHNIGEESGMDNCATWVRKFISEVPVQFIPSGDPFWRTIKS